MAENKEQKTFIVKNKRSSLFTEKNGTVKNAAEEGVVITPGSKPKLIPNEIDDSKFGFGEIAINFVEGLETIQIKNSGGKIATFQNEVLVIDEHNKTEYLDENGNLKKATTAKLVIDLTDESSDESGNSEVNSEYITFMKSVNEITITDNSKDLTVDTDAHLNIFKISPDTDNETYTIVINSELKKGYEIITVIKNSSDKSCTIDLGNNSDFVLENNSVAQVAFISGGEEIYGRIL